MSRWLAVAIALYVTAAHAAPIHDAAAAGDIAKVRALLTQDPASVNARDEFGSTPLAFACGEGHREVVLLLLRSGADVNAKNGSGRTAIVAAVHRGRTEIVEVLLFHKASTNVRLESGSTLLHKAALRGWPTIVQLLIENGKMDPNVADNLGLTPLHEAAAGGFPAVVLTLLTLGAHVDAKDGSGRTPVDVAVANGHREVAELLKSRGGTSGVSGH